MTKYPTRYFIRSRRLARKLTGLVVQVAMREMDAEEAEPHLRAQERREQREREAAHASVAEVESPNG